MSRNTNQITEVTFQVKRDTHTRFTTGFKVWHRTGYPQDDPSLDIVYEGKSFAEAYESATKAMETA